MDTVEQMYGKMKHNPNDLYTLRSKVESVSDISS